MSSLERGDFMLNVNIDRIDGPFEDLRAATRTLTRTILISAVLITLGLIWVGLRLHR